MKRFSTAFLNFLFETAFNLQILIYGTVKKA